MLADLIYSTGWFAISLALTWRLRSRRRSLKVVAIRDGRSSQALRSWRVGTAPADPVSSFQLGCDDARALRPMRTGMPSDYYNGYSYTCAVDGLS